MVQVPRYSRQQVAVQPLGNVRQQIAVSPETFGAGQARALEQGGQQLRQVGAQLGQAAVNQQIRHNEATAKTAYANWQAEITPVLTEYESLQGQNAVGALEATRARIEEINTRILGGVQGDSAREMVEQQIQGRMPAIGAGLDRHYNRQLEVYETEASQARIGANIQQGIASPSTIPDMELEILAEVTQRGRDAGQADEVIRANALEYISSMHISVIDRLLAENGASVAAGHLATHGEKIVPSERVKVEARIERARKQEIVVARAQLSEGLKDEVASLRRTGRRAGVVSDAQILASYGMEGGGEIVASLNREAAFYEVRQEVATNTPAEDAALLAAIAPGAPTPTADPTEGLPDPAVVVRTKPLVELEEGGQSYERTITITDEAINGGRPTNIPTIWDGQQVSDDDAIRVAAESGQTFPAYGTVESAAAAARERSEAIGRAAEVEPFRVEGEGFREEAERYDLLLKAAQDKYAALAADPAAYVMQTQPQIVAAFSDSNVTPGQAVALRMQAQEQLGVPSWRLTPLTTQEAESLVGEITALPTASVAGEMLRLERQYGRQWPAVFSQLAGEGLPQPLQLLGAVASEPGLSQTLAQAIDNGPTELRKGFEQADTRDLRLNVESELSEFRLAFEAADPTGGAARQVNGIVDTAELLALQYLRSSYAGDPAGAARQAAEDLVLSRFHVSTGRLQGIVPRVIDGRLVDMSEIERGTDFLLTRASLTAADIAPIGDVMETPEFLDFERTVRAVETSGFFVNNEQNTGVVLMVPFVNGGAIPMIDGQGQRIEYSYEEVMAAAQQARAVDSERETPGDVRRREGAPQFRPRTIATPERAE